MKSVRLFVLAAILMLVVLPLTGGGTAAPPGPSYVPGEVLLKFKVDAQLADKVRLMGELGATELHQFVSGAVHWKLAPGLDVL